MNFRTALYSRYRSTHNSHMYGHVTLQGLEREFRAFDLYYGKVLPPTKDARILDLGCGDGNFVYYLQRRGFSNACGVDLSAEQIEVGQKLGIRNLTVMDAQAFLREGRVAYDLIIARDVIEHCTKQEAFDMLNVVSAHLTPTGCFAMQVPNGEGIFSSTIIYGDYTHETVYTITSGRQLLLNTGFSSVAAHAIDPLPLGVFGRLRALLWKLRVAQHRFWKMVETGSGRGIFTSNILLVGRK